MTRGLRRRWRRCIHYGLAVASAIVGAQACAGQGRAEKAGMGEGERYLALGDSYTIGEGVEAGERWPAQLAALLRARGIDVAEPEIVARTGRTTDELDAAIDEAAPRGPYGLVSLLIGVNDQYRGGPVSIYRPQFTALLRRVIGF